MVGQLDQISRAIGSLETSVNGLHEDITENRDIANTRHQENKARLTSIEEAMRPALASITAMQPIVATLQAGRSRLVFWAGVGMTAVTFLGWGVELGVRTVFEWGVAHWR